jgi:hypothetical protein
VLSDLDCSLHLLCLGRRISIGQFKEEHDRFLITFIKKRFVLCVSGFSKPALSTYHTQKKEHQVYLFGGKRSLTKRSQIVPSPAPFNDFVSLM